MTSRTPHGLIPVGTQIQFFFVCPMLVSCRLSHFSHLFPSIKFTMFIHLSISAVIKKKSSIEKTELARAVDVMTAEANRIYTLMIKVNKVFFLFHYVMFQKK